MFCAATTRLPSSASCLQTALKRSAAAIAARNGNNTKFPIVPFVWTTPVTDAIFVTLLVVHSHWGIEAIVIDYIRPKLFGGSTVIPNICVALVWALSAVTLGGLFYFNYTDVGVVNAIKMLWTKV